MDVHDDLFDRFGWLRMEYLSEHILQGGSLLHDSFDCDRTHHSNMYSFLYVITILKQFSRIISYVSQPLNKRWRLLGHVITSFLSPFLNHIESELGKMPWNVDYFHVFDGWHHEI